MTIAELLANARRQLADASHRPAPREAALLLSRLLQLDEARLMAHDTESVPPSIQRRFAEWLDRRLAGEPVAYLFQEREFYGRPFHVDSRVLIPRPETEHLVEAVLALNLLPSSLVLEIGTGCGAVAITLALERPAAGLLATERSLGALAVAAQNRARYDLHDRVRLVAADLATCVNVADPDAVVCNPPYLGDRESASLSPEVTQFEPAAALFAGSRGDEVLARLIRELAFLSPGTPVCLEIGADQAEHVRRLVTGSEFALLELRRDLAGHNRVAVLERR